MKRLLPIILFVAFASTLFGQEIDISKYRTIDGSHNNLTHTNWGAAGENLELMVPLAYSDSVSAPAGIDRPNPREISNNVFTQISNTTDPLQLSDFVWAWGQFLDHDVGLTPDGQEFLPIPVPQGDRWFDPNNTGQMMIPTMRNLFDPVTGTSPQNPRRHPNMITAYIDGTTVYGFEEEQAAWLRSFEGGKLKVSAGNLLPFNTTTGEYEAPVDHSVPEMENPVGMSEKIFVAGDVRANENIILLSLHTLFVREHNRLCDELASKHPDWSDQQLYLHARKLNNAFMQAITYNEFLPALGVVLPPYEGYNTEVNAQLANVFTAAAFRMGHTLLNGTLQRVLMDGTPHPDGPVLLRDVFFNPLVAMEEGGIEIFLKGMGVQPQQEFDAVIVDDIRNFLFGPPGSGGMDLAAINIQRGRERGLPDFNTIRRELGLEPYEIFRQINFSNVGSTFDLLASYSDVNKIDPWVGMLAERRMPGSILGETVIEILKRQFTALRDGDRFFYLNDPVLTDEEKEMISKTTLNKIIMRNTAIDLMQDNVFAAMPHEEICDNMTVEVLGNVWTEIGVPVFGVGIDLQAGTSFLTGATSNNGRFGFSAVPGCGNKLISLNKNDAHDNGLSTLDLILVQKHILGRDPLNTPYKLLAADVDMSGTISTLDLIKMRKVILSIDVTLNSQASWRFVPEHFQFSDPTNPFLDDIPTSVDIESNGFNYSQNFIAVKLGDVNSSADPGNTTQARDGFVETRAEGLRLKVDNIQLQAGQQYTIELTAGDLATVAGYQLGLRFQPTALEVIDIEADGLENMSESNFAILNREGLIAHSWNSQNGEPVDLDAGDRLFTLRILAKETAALQEVLQLDRRRIQAEAYGVNLSTRGVALNFTNDESSSQNFMVYQNQPNPFSESTRINFYLPNADQVSLSVIDAAGRTVLQRQANFEAGDQQWIVSRSELGAGGVYYYQIATETGAITKRMILK